MGLVLVVILLAVGPAAASSGFSDVEDGYWAGRYIDILRTHNVINGFPDGTFRPEDKVTRAQFTKMLMVALGFEEDSRILAGIPSSFVDVPNNHWSKGYLEAARELGIVTGYEEGKFGPEREVTQVEAIVILVRALGWEPEAIKATGSIYPGMDQTQVPSWASGHIYLAAQRGLLAVMKEDVFSFSDATSRALAAALIVQMMELRESAFDLSGTLIGFDPSSFEISFRAGDKRISLPLARGAPLYLNGKGASPQDLWPLDEVFLILVGNLATYVEGWRLDQEGLLVERYPERGSVAFLADGTSAPQHYLLAADARIFLNARAANLRELKAGDRVYVVFQAKQAVVRILDAVRTEFYGTVTGVDLVREDEVRARLRVLITGGTEETFVLTRSTLIFRGGAPALPGEILPGSHITFHVEERSEGAVLNGERVIDYLEVLGQVDSL